MTVRPAHFALLLALALFVAACASNGPSVGAPANPALAGTSWGLTNIRGASGAPMARIDDSSRYRLRFGADGQVQAQLDCNSGGGPWASAAPGEVTIGPLMSTMMGCQPNSLGGVFATDLGKVDSFAITEGRLYLTLKSGGGTLIFRPIPWI